MKEYYTPSLDDLVEGYEFEIQVYDEDKDEYKDEWRKEKFDVCCGLGYDNYATFCEGHVRTQHLTPAQIEAEGWEQLAIKMYFRKGVYSLSDLGDGRYAIYNEASEDNLFYGRLPSINEFRKICKLIGVND